MFSLPKKGWGTECDCCGRETEDLYWHHLDGFDPKARYEITLLVCTTCTQDPEKVKAFERARRDAAHAKASERYKRRHPEEVG